MNISPITNPDWKKVKGQVPFIGSPSRHPALPTFGERRMAARVRDLPRVSCYLPPYEAGSLCRYRTKDGATYIRTAGKGAKKPGQVIRTSPRAFKRVSRRWLKRLAQMKQEIRSN